MLAHRARGSVVISHARRAERSSPVRVAGAESADSQSASRKLSSQEAPHNAPGTGEGGRAVAVAGHGVRILTRVAIETRAALAGTLSIEGARSRCEDVASVASIEPTDKPTVVGLQVPCALQGVNVPSPLSMRPARRGRGFRARKQHLPTAEQDSPRHVFGQVGMPQRQALHAALQAGRGKVKKGRQPSPAKAMRTSWS